MHFYVMMQKTREIDWCPKYEVSERFGSFKLSNSNAVAVRMAREYCGNTRQLTRGVLTFTPRVMHLIHSSQVRSEAKHE